MKTDFVAHWYEGRCPQTGAWLRLPRTLEVEAIAHQLMQTLTEDEQSHREGKMYGVLLVRTAGGERQVLKAFSGLLNGDAAVAGWVPPIPGRSEVVLEEAQALASLETLKQEILALAQIPERQHYQMLVQDFEQQSAELAAQHRLRKQQRDRDRQFFQQTLTEAEWAIAQAQLNRQSQQDGIERRHFKRRRATVLQPLQQKIEQADERMGELKQQRRELSRTLQAQMHQTYRLINFWGTSATLQALMPEGLPTGTGDCCAPKLLHYAATHHLHPIALAEFWWGPPSRDGSKRQGNFYGACLERCQPLLGFLLSGLTQCQANLSIVYEDEWLISVEKPAGLLSVPGRTSDRQDSVLSRLRSHPDRANLLAVHRLDQDTSGLLLLARTPEVHHHLSQQFRDRRVYKQYTAILAGSVMADEGVIELPLWGDPGDRPRQKVDWQHGKSSITKFRVLSRDRKFTRVEFVPITGRSHQLRVHAADPAGLGVPILGDRLYGAAATLQETGKPEASRLYLHAQRLRFAHPHTQQFMELETHPVFPDFA